MAILDGNLADNLLVGTAEDDVLNGQAGDDVLLGGAGNDQLDGGLGIDQLVGGAGDDVYFVDRVGDRILEEANEGFDIVLSSTSYILSDNVEALGLIGNDDLAGIGNRLDNLFLGNSGNNLLVGLEGNDIFLASAGNDNLNGGTGFDTADYLDIAAPIVFDVVSQTVDKGDLGVDQLIEIETVVAAEGTNSQITAALGNPNLALDIDLAQQILGVTNLATNRQDIYQVVNFSDVFGGSQADFIAGDNGQNWLSGGGGDDLLFGDGGGDLLEGGSGDDALGGGAGSDVLNGGSGSDVLVGFGGNSAQIDILTGGSGTDFFFLGDGNEVFYQGHDSEAIITDFDLTSDFLVLPFFPLGSEAESLGYSFQLGDFGVGSGSLLDTAVMLGGDRIAILADVTDVSFGRDVLFIEPAPANVVQNGTAWGTDLLNRFDDFFPFPLPEDRPPTPPEESEAPGEPELPEPPSATPAPADGNNTLAEATEFMLTEPLMGQVDGGDRSDFYRFTATESGVFTASLDGLSGDADVRLIRDENGNGEIDTGEILAWQWERGADSESIRRFLDAGDYFVEVMSYNDNNAEYQLATEFSASEADPLAFSIELNFGIGLTGLTDSAKTAIEDAVLFWEDVITHSSFDTAQTLEVTLAATDLGGREGILAYVPFLQPTQLLTTTGDPGVLEAGDRLLPTSGDIVLNQFYFDDYNQDPSYIADIVRHEMGHVLGIGSLWDYNEGLINRRDSTYSADTYAGAVYGEMLGTFEQTAVPIEPFVNGHWDESVFESELLTPQAEGIGAEMPLSNLTIASLRDLGWNVNFGVAEDFMLGSSVV